MVLTLEHLEHRCEQGQLAGAWSTLLHAFERSILDTHRSKFTQYLLWYLCKQAGPITGPADCHFEGCWLSTHSWGPGCPCQRWLVQSGSAT